ncbi:hypothetical protein TPSD3_05920 [Thioflexithrix psekupsensis]|uniref:DUF488 domain-containing protein n=1 Tax=Thioflexithrix psekupsensis TaxID=1570016 RepID=A0A251X9I5_9GAMM|nr:hypothetical protein TPSD3_05920 [Thioflexithrix psekupsensis]
MKIFTIGFTKKTAKQFFLNLKKAGVKCVIDARLNNTSQLAGFTKKEDLKFFLQEICNIDYLHLPNLAPTKIILETYKNTKNWKLYEEQFINLMTSRQIETLDPKIINNSCLLCSEETPEFCHRRLVAEYLYAKWEQVEIQHL